jgi:hypothetical protein
MIGGDRRTLLAAYELAHLASGSEHAVVSE